MSDNNEVILEPLYIEKFQTKKCPWWNLWKVAGPEPVQDKIANCFTTMLSFNLQRNLEFSHLQLENPDHQGTIWAVNLDNFAAI